MFMVLLPFSELVAETIVSAWATCHQAESAHAPSRGKSSGRRRCCSLLRSRKESEQVRGLASGELASGGFGDFGVGVGVSIDAPPTVGCLADLDPCAFREAGVAAGSGADPSHLLDHPWLGTANHKPAWCKDREANVGALP